MNKRKRNEPIIFAEILLNDSGMKNVSASYPNEFGEDVQTVTSTSFRLPALTSRPGRVPP
jgi:hypothetical protein